MQKKNLSTVHSTLDILPFTHTKTCWILNRFHFKKILQVFYLWVFGSTSHMEYVTVSFKKSLIHWVCVPSVKNPGVLYWEMTVIQVFARCFQNLNEAWSHNFVFLPHLLIFLMNGKQNWTEKRLSWYCEMQKTSMLTSVKGGVGWYIYYPCLLRSPWQRL